MMAAPRPGPALSVDGQAMRPALIWRKALKILCRRLEAGGLPIDRAIEIGESTIIACALQHEPRSVGEALELAVIAARQPQQH